MTDGHIEVVAGLLRKNNQYLITKRPREKHLGGMWEFPGGKKETGESDPEALKRELREELHLPVQVDQQIHKVRHSYSDRTVEIRFFRCSIPNNHSPEPIECDELKWVPPQDLDNYSFPPADQEFLSRIQQEHF